ncbi:hypothetical protein CROQUDRAFT_720412 [Cronartium quercuum f. sp. fusiforme G11]|uniref:MFS general substrate transporter n=1 Tax=Cronartium quercuum f. sp. fusiforme G11 TaxID=708437 RepID=A0A9P6NVX4_9BASI|nr:hypothetical protein CROQUDRAFT_720412 [Cronartium quercuum f. sp. fusiforme G11]
MPINLKRRGASLEVGVKIQDDQPLSTTNESFGLSVLKDISPTSHRIQVPRDMAIDPSDADSTVTYKVYKRRFLGLVILALLNGISSLNSVIFSTITTETAMVFRTSLTRINWLSNVFSVVFVAVAWFVPLLVERFAIRWVCVMAGGLMTIGSWIRFFSVYTINAQTNSSDVAGYSLVLVGSLIISVSQPLLLILGPAFSELWFSPSTRLTATMIVSVSNPIGQALAELLAPAIVPENAKVSEMRMLLLICACATTAITLGAAGIGNRPPTPPSAISQLPRHSAWEGFRVLLGFKTSSKLNDHQIILKTSPQSNTHGIDLEPTISNWNHFFDCPITHLNKFTKSGVIHLGSLTIRDRVDFLLLTLLFGTLLGAFTTYSILIEQIYSPYGYDSNQSGYFGVACIVSGLLSTIISVPLFALFFPRSRGHIIKIFGPLIGLSYFGLIWIVKSKDLIAIYIFNVGIGVFSFISLPIALELGADITYTAMTPDSAAAVLYLVGNAFSVIFLVIMDTLRSDSTTLPPFDMNRALIFQVNKLHHHLS